MKVFPINLTGCLQAAAQKFHCLNHTPCFCYDVILAACFAGQFAGRMQNKTGIDTHAMKLSTCKHGLGLEHFSTQYLAPDFICTFPDRPDRC